MSKKSNNHINNQIKIDVKGNLGILALGDVGLRAWRNVKEGNNSKSDDKK